MLDTMALLVLMICVCRDATSFDRKFATCALRVLFALADAVATAASMTVFCVAILLAISSLVFTASALVPLRVAICACRVVSIAMTALREDVKLDICESQCVLAEERALAD